MIRYFTSIQRRYADAERLFMRSLAIREKVFSPDHPEVKQSRDNLAELHRSLGLRSLAPTAVSPELPARVINPAVERAGLRYALPRRRRPYGKPSPRRRSKT